jgi:uncharacterized protein (DUF58 family)
VTTPDDGGWRPTRALHRAGALVALTLLLATVLGRRELVILAVPFVLGTAVSLARRPVGAPKPTLQLDRSITVEGGPVQARVLVRNDEPVTLLCVVAMRTSRWIRLDHGSGRYAAVVGPSQAGRVLVRGTALRWGDQRIGPADVRLYACDGLLRTDRVALQAQRQSVYPVSEHFDSGEPLPRASGVSGIHRSRRPGDGGELADVRPFQMGDKLRRINWRVSHRTGELYVNSTLSEREADVLLVLDVRHEAGSSGGIGGTASVLDATVRAAAAIGEHYTHQGDRVSLVEFGPRLRRLPAGTGRRHFLAALEWLVDVNLAPTGLSPGYELFSRQLRPTNALLVVLTPLLDTDSALLLAMLARAGRTLVAVDTLPDELGRQHRTEWARAAEQVWLLERENTIGRLREVGVPVEKWRGAGSLDAVLRHMYRLVTTARGVRR